MPPGHSLGASQRHRFPEEHEDDRPFVARLAAALRAAALAHARFAAAVPLALALLLLLALGRSAEAGTRGLKQAAAAPNGEPCDPLAPTAQHRVVAGRSRRPRRA